MASRRLRQAHRCTQSSQYPLGYILTLTQTISLHNSKRWCMTSYRVFEKLIEMFPPNDFMDHGVRMRMANFFFDQVLEDMPDKGQLEKFEEIVGQADVSILPSSGFGLELTRLPDQGHSPRSFHHQRTCREPASWLCGRIPTPCSSHRHRRLHELVAVYARVQGCSHGDPPHQRRPTRPGGAASC